MVALIEDDSDYDNEEGLSPRPSYYMALKKAQARQRKYLKEITSLPPEERETESDTMKSLSKKTDKKYQSVLKLNENASIIGLNGNGLAADDIKFGVDDDLLNSGPEEKKCTGEF